MPKRNDIIPSNRHPGRSRTRPESVHANTETMVKAAHLRASGASFREIGEALGIDYSWARDLVIRALEQATYEAADVMRTQEGARLDRMQRAVWPAAITGDIPAVNTVLKIMERRAKLFGLDAPVKVETDVAIGTGVDAEVERLALMLESAEQTDADPA